MVYVVLPRSAPGPHPNPLPSNGRGGMFVADEGVAAVMCVGCLVGMPLCPRFPLTLTHSHRGDHCKTSTMGCRTLDLRVIPLCPTPLDSGLRRNDGGCRRDGGSIAMVSRREEGNVGGGLVCCGDVWVGRFVGMPHSAPGIPRSHSFACSRPFRCAKGAFGCFAGSRLVTPGEGRWVQYWVYLLRRVGAPFMPSGDRIHILNSR